ncbi:hypothetical protein EON65_51050 [archaeon]|nr:MAG: hypothetical protein EON65_51050 [archaeon]
MCINSSTPYPPLNRERFHPFTPGHHLDYRPPANGDDWYVKYNPNLKLGYDCCSAQSVSFHYLPPPMQQKLHNYVYNCESRG